MEFIHRDLLDLGGNRVSRVFVDRNNQASFDPEPGPAQELEAILRDLFQIFIPALLFDIYLDWALLVLARVFRNDSVHDAS
ncbi:MAG: hypothetical protein Q6370_020395 [Candidatus Sigynarchaeota archaeon]